MNWMRKKNCKMKFLSITDDVEYAENLLPDVPAHHFSIGSDYSIINRARNLVLSNSSFAFFPAWTNLNAKNIIAPKYWARHNVSDGFWACEFNIYKNWNWLGRDGKTYSHLECQAELNDYKENNPHFFTKQIPLKKGVVHNLYIKTKDFLSLQKKKLLH